MTHFERNLLQDATYWAPIGEDEFGKVTYAAPVVLKCRWEDKVEQIRDKKGQELSTKSRIFFMQDILLDGYLFLGISIDTDPLNVVKAYEIMQVSRIPDLRLLRTIYMAHI